MTSPSSAAARASCKERKLVCRLCRGEGEEEVDEGRGATAKAFSLLLLLQSLRGEPWSSSSSSDSPSRAGAGRPSHSEPASAGRTFEFFILSFSFSSVFFLSLFLDVKRKKRSLFLSPLKRSRRSRQTSPHGLLPELLRLPRA